MMIKIYTDLDSMFDTRRGIIHRMAVENGKKDFDWDKNFKEIYNRRRMDYFHQPELGITNDEYKERFKNRSVDDWADESTCYFIPSQLLANMFLQVRVIEFGVGQVIAVSDFELTINIWPYALTDGEIQTLKTFISDNVNFPISIRILNTPNQEQTQTFYSYFNYVFKYGFLTSEENKPYWDKYAAVQPIDTRFFVPDILVKELPEEMQKDSIITIINKMNLVQGSKITLIAIPKSNFDAV